MLTTKVSGFFDCTTIEETICNSNERHDDCCLRTCALELQSAVVCAFASSSGQDRLECGDPVCGSPIQNNNITIASVIYEMRDGNVTTDDEISQVLHFEERGCTSDTRR